LIRLSHALREKRPEYEQKHDKVFLHEARPHVAKVIKKYLEMLKWDVLPHPSYSPDIAPSDYWLFRRMHQITGSLLSQKLAPKLDHQKRVIFSRWNSKIA